MNPRKRDASTRKSKGRWRRLRPSHSHAHHTYRSTLHPALTVNTRSANQRIRSPTRLNRLSSPTLQPPTYLVVQVSSTSPTSSTTCFPRARRRVAPKRRRNSTPVTARASRVPSRRPRRTSRRSADHVAQWSCLGPTTFGKPATSPSMCVQEGFVSSVLVRGGRGGGGSALRGSETPCRRERQRDGHGRRGREGADMLT